MTTLLFALDQVRMNQTFVVLVMFYDSVSLSLQLKELSLLLRVLRKNMGSMCGYVLYICFWLLMMIIS